MWLSIKTCGPKIFKENFSKSEANGAVLFYTKTPEFSVSQDELFKISEESSVSILFKLAGIRKFSAEYAFESVQVQQFLQRQDLHYDLVINEEFFQESFSMFAYKYKTPLVTISKENHIRKCNV